MHALVELFSRLVEAVAESGKREEECRLVEDKADELLSDGDVTHLEVRGDLNLPLADGSYRMPCVRGERQDLHSASVRWSWPRIPRAFSGIMSRSLTL